ncbi:TetR family transcriptional regulator C-terminal domain-containing protein [Aureitalea marina]|uniref:Heat-shock protein n=1 Tax=Aureitalea marina TaxID=930804 RepID=A0A2S7KQA2_9FLAO|nr:TetR family transcriptional regulator C-terminal domain-containing protein [Aureitalea marina]PQB04790.1 heat-shock protein [Aureitalea marina]
MSTKQKTARTKTKKLSREDIVALYMNAVLEQSEFPTNVYKFCQEQKIDEAEFYNHFGSLESLRQAIWGQFHHMALGLTQKARGYGKMAAKEKLLTYYFTLFELLTANRSYVLFALDRSEAWSDRMKQLSGLRKGVKSFAKELIEDANDGKTLGIFKHPVELFSEGAWAETIMILKFWMRDDSPKFEETDAFIEKSIRAVFDLFETTPLESVFDLGKFLWKDRMA